MKLRTAVFLLACGSGFSAESFALPPVIDNSAYPANATPNLATPAVSASPSNNVLLEIMGRLEQLQAEVQQLTGKVEEQANLIAELKKQQTGMYGDFDDRLQNLENKTTDSSQLPSGISPEPAATSEPQTTAPAPADEKTPDSAPTESGASPNVEPKPVKSSQPTQAIKPEAVQVSDIEKQEYQQAYTALRTGRTSESITAFKTYLEKYPTGGYANNAQYWLGEAYRVNQDNDSARQAFNDVIEKYPNSAKVPDAILKLGYIEMDQKNSAKAREYLIRVTSEFPNTAAARLAAKKLQLLDTISN